MNVPLLDLKAQYRSIKAEIDAAVGAVFESQYFILGPTVQACERDVAAYCGCAHAVGVSSGTDALLICLMAEGIGAGDEVITTPYSFFATAGSIARLGAKPVFVDIDPITFNINPALIEAAVTPRTKAIMPVHLFGQVADMDPIMQIARSRNLVVIEDACQAIGAEYKRRRAGSIGHYGCFSFFPSKNLGGAGDGGMVTTNDPARAEKLVWLRNHGMNPKYYHKMLGGNFRLDALQAAVVHVKLKHLDRWTEGRQANAARYDSLLADTSVQLPAVVMNRHIFNQYCIRTARRDELLKHLQQNGVGCEVYYPVPLHLQECFAPVGSRPSTFPESEKAAGESLALPIFPELSTDQAAFVAETIRGFFR
ncbi:MAG: DegT/DnrJ/EryC1/StrS family aminotransferase [bacterium]